MSMDVDSPGVIPGTPSADDYAASLAGTDGMSRPVTPAEDDGQLEHAGKQEEGDLTVTAASDGEALALSNGHTTGASTPVNGTPAAFAIAGAPVIVQEMDLDTPEDDQAEGQSLAAHRLERASSTSSSVNLKASTKSSSKRKPGAVSAGSRAQSPAPGPDSTTLAKLPLFVPSAIPGFYTTRNHPMNKSGYRYTACTPSPYWNDELKLWHISPSPPADLVRFSWEDRSSYTHISTDALAVSTDKGFRSAKANVPIREGAWYFEFIVEKGAGDPDGYTKVDAFGPHVRLGIGRREAPLNAPIGFDAYSYGLRDKTGDKVHIAKTKSYGESFGTGDVIGVYVYLPPRPSPSITADQPGYADDELNPARIVRKRVAIRYKNQLYFESMEYVQSKEMEDLAAMTKDPAAFERAKQAAEAALKQRSAPPPGRRRAPPPPVPPPPRPLPILEGSKVAFFKNGECQGLAYEDLFDWLPLRPHVKNKPGPRVSVAAAIAAARENLHDDGALGYYPMASVFSGGVARLNAGPEFRCPPPADIEAEIAQRSGLGEPDNHGTPWRPLSECYAEFFAEQKRLDQIDDAVALANYARQQQQQAQTAAMGRSSQQAQAYPVHQQYQQPPYPTIATPGHLSNGPSPPSSTIGNSHVKRKTGLSNELIPTRESSTGAESGDDSSMQGGGLAPADALAAIVKLEEQDAEGSPEPEMEEDESMQVKDE